MNEFNLSGTLLEQDVRRSEADKRPDSSSKPLEEVIALARDEIAGVFSKRPEKLIAASR